MSDLQLSLLVLGAIVVAAVLAFNWYQERNYRKRAERALETPADDPLLDIVPANVNLGGDDLLSKPIAKRPTAPASGDAPATVGLSGFTPGQFASSTAAAPALQSSSAPSARSAAPAAPRAETQLSMPSAPAKPATAQERPEPVVDYHITIESKESLTDKEVSDLEECVSTLPRAVHLAGYDQTIGKWVTLGARAGDHYRRLRFSMQLADRQGIATPVDFEEFTTQLRETAERLDLKPIIPDTRPFQKRAQELDKFYETADIAIGISVIADGDTKFEGRNIVTLAEGAGMELQPDGLFHYESKPGVTQFTLDNHDPEPFFADNLALLKTTGVTFLFDVPRASEGLVAYDKMVAIVKQFATTLGGVIVDDNREPLNEAGLDATRRLLETVYESMADEGIDPGSPTAQRLFA